MLSPQVITALNHANEILQTNSQNQYQLIATRGYIHWGAWRKCRAMVAKCLFCILYYSDKRSADCLFGHNGHNDGYSIDVWVYDTLHERILQWLPWNNIFMTQDAAQKLRQKNQYIIGLVNDAMQSAGFIPHADPREQLQMHYRLKNIPPHPKKWMRLYPTVS